VKRDPVQEALTETLWLFDVDDDLADHLLRIVRSVVAEELGSMASFVKTSVKNGDPLDETVLMVTTWPGIKP
jgi:hypothetical protein